MIFPIGIYQFLKTPKTYLLELQKKHGDPFPLSFPGVPTVWLTGKSVHAKSIFSAEADSFKVSENNPVAPLLGSNGLIMQSGPPHLAQRKALVPDFSKRSLLPLSSTIVDVFFEHHKNSKPSGTLVIQEFALKTTLKIILRFLFPHLDRPQTAEAEELTNQFLKSYSAFFLFVPKWVPGTWNNFNSCKNKLDERFYDFYLSGLKGNSPGPLSHLQSSSKEQILDHIRTFIIAGHETSATSLTWALYYIHKNISVKNRLREELCQSADLPQEKFLETLLSNDFLSAVIDETLRIQSPVPFVTRKVINRKFMLGEKALNIDDELGVCILLLHQQPELWTNPSEFQPERFLGRKYAASEYAPFGGGTRRCIGSELALLELKILIAYYLKYFDSKLTSTHSPRPEVLQITLGPKKPIVLSYQLTSSYS